MKNRPLYEWSASEAVKAIRDGEITAEALTVSCLDRIRAREETVQAWIYLDPEAALARARELDARQAAGGPLGPLHGVPVAIKDIFDTADMPTENGSNRYKGRRPTLDGFAVQLLRQAGAVILGKTVTTEIAMSTPGKTRNPHDPERTPGGSSSGSCAALGDFMAPIGLGSQTSGSTLRPASYCGVHGYKPTFGSISCTGVSPLSRKLDHVGPLARSLEDLALLSDVLMVGDSRDGEMRADPGMGLVEALARPVQGAPRLGFCRTPAWEEGDPDAFAIFESFVAGLGTHAEEVDLPESFAGALDHHTNVIGAGLAYFYAEEVTRDPPLMDSRTLERIANGLEVKAGDYLRSLDARDTIEADINELLRGYEALIVPPATGEAPIGFESTGSPVFQAPWTLLGMPGLCLPLLKGPNGLPFGVQLMGRKGDDPHLFRVAKWLEAFVEAAR